MDQKKLESLRRELDDIDAELVSAIARRQNLVMAIGQVKAEAGRETRDFSREKVVLDKGAALAERVGIESELVVDVLKTLIRYSLTRQEQDRLQTHSAGQGGTALVVGGLGRMGRWMVAFLASQGFAVSVADPAATDESPNQYRSLEESGDDFDVIVVSATLQQSEQVLRQLHARRPRGVIMDVGSLKSPLRSVLQDMVADGLQVTSIHPMFGPATQVLAGKQVIFVDVGCPAANERARALFAATMATPIDMDVDEHDRMIAFVLGLSHATGIAFVDALANSGLPGEALMALSSPTYDALLGLGRTLVHENPELYFEIQSLNDFGSESLSVLRESIGRLAGAVDRNDVHAFVSAMQAGRQFVGRHDRAYGRSG